MVYCQDVVEVVATENLVTTAEVTLYILGSTERQTGLTILKAGSKVRERDEFRGSAEVGNLKKVKL